jgi:hypothetical protein
MLGRVEYKEHEIRNHFESSGNLSTLLSLSLSLSLTHTHTHTHTHTINVHIVHVVSVKLLNLE